MRKWPFFVCLFFFSISEPGTGYCNYNVRSKCVILNLFPFSLQAELLRLWVQLFTSTFCSQSEGLSSLVKNKYPQDACTASQLPLICSDFPHCCASTNSLSLKWPPFYYGQQLFSPSRQNWHSILSDLVKGVYACASVKLQETAICGHVSRISLDSLRKKRERCGVTTFLPTDNGNPWCCCS